MNENQNEDFFNAFEDHNINAETTEIEVDVSEEQNENTSYNLDEFESNAYEENNTVNIKNEDTQNQNNFSSNNLQEDEVQPFDVKKVSAEDVMNGSKPPMLNRNFIIAVIGSVFTLFIVFAVFIFPMISQRKAKEDKTKPIASENRVVDYSMLVDKKQKQSFSSDNNKVEKEKEVALDEDGFPPVNDKYKPKESQQSNNNVIASGRISDVPDTSGDPLQGKTISGIKGISSTQKRYLTDPDSWNQVAPTNTQALDSSNPYAKFGLPDRNTYTQQMLELTKNSGNSGNSYLNQNDQSGKNNFYSKNQGNVSGTWLAKNTVWQGSIFEAVLTSNINTDLPGECTAIITKNVYSSQDGSMLLIPQNSKLYGAYNSSISYSQGRVQVGWHTLIRPDGYEQTLGNMNATDAQGASGLKGFINNHPFQYLKALGLMSFFNIISTEFNNVSNTTNPYIQNIAANSQTIANTLGSKLIDRAIDVQPTITIKSGTKINIVANTTLILPPLEDYPVTEPYHR